MQLCMTMLVSRVWGSYEMLCMAAPPTSPEDDPDDFTNSATVRAMLSPRTEKAGRSYASSVQFATRPVSHALSRPRSGVIRAEGRPLERAIASASSVWGPTCRCRPKKRALLGGHRWWVHDVHAMGWLTASGCPAGLHTGTFVLDFRNKYVNNDIS